MPKVESLVMAHRLFSDFKYGLKANRVHAFRPDEYPYFLSWPLVFLFSKTKITPIQTGNLSLLFGIIFVIGLGSGYHLSNPGLMFMLMAFRIILDCADGQLARYTDQISNLGALNDLVTDFVFTLLLFFGLCYFLVSVEQMSPALAISACLLGTVSLLFSSTAFSYIARLSQSPGKSSKTVRKEFVAPFINDYPQERIYTKQLKLYNLLFRLTWRWVSILVIRLFFRDGSNANYRLLSLVFSPMAYGIHLTVFGIMVLFQVSVIYFLIYEISAFCIMVLLLLITQLDT